MKPAVLFIAIITTITFISCDNNTTDTGSILFYSNVQALVNCGPFDVNIYINNEFGGTISEPYMNANLPECVNSNSTLLVKLVPGIYNYSAEFDCGQLDPWTGTVVVKSDSCSYIFFDFNTR